MSDETQPAPARSRFAPPQFLVKLWNRIRTSSPVVRLHSFSYPENEQVYTDPGFEFLSADKVIRIGLTVVGVFVIGFLGWAAFAPLDSAIVAQGVVVVETHRKPIQHL